MRDLEPCFPKKAERLLRRMRVVEEFVTEHAVCEGRVIRAPDREQEAAVRPQRTAHPFEDSQVPLSRYVKDRVPRDRGMESADRDVLLDRCLDPFASWKPPSRKFEHAQGPIDARHPVPEIQSALGDGPSGSAPEIENSGTGRSDAEHEFEEPSLWLGQRDANGIPFTGNRVVPERVHRGA